MRTTTLVLNAIVVVFFCCFFASTFFARQYFDSVARDFVSEKTLTYSKPLVEVADESLDSPLVRKFLSDEQAAAIRDQIADYQNDPAAYIADLTGQRERVATAPIANPMLKKIFAIKQQIRTYYDNTLDALIVDLRIFSLSNLVAGLVALGLAYRCSDNQSSSDDHSSTDHHSSTDIHKPIVWFSFLMFAAVLYCSYLYVDGLTFFRILFRMHMGWWYAALLCVMVVALYLDNRRHANGSKSFE